MNRWAVIRTGGIELALAALLSFLVFPAAFLGRVPAVSVVVDVAALVVVVISQRWLRLGVALSFAVIGSALLLDPDGVGMALYLCMLPVVTAIRKDEFPLAIVATIVNAAAGFTISYQLSGDESDWIGALMGWLFLYGIAWAVGMGMRAVARAESQKLRNQYRQRELALAWELHDSVARNLAILAMQANAARNAGTATPEELDVIAEQARLASKSVREVTQLLGGWDRAPAPDVTMRAAVVAGTQELRQMGFTVKASLQIPELPADVDKAAGRIIQEALHNVAKHGSKNAPCVVTVEVTPETLELVVTNAVALREESYPGLGLTSMRYRSDALGGSFSSKRIRGSWVCEASLPLNTSSGRTVQN